MGYRGMVVLQSEDYGETMELVHCIKEKVGELIEHLGNAEMGERRGYRPEFDDEAEMYRFGERRGGSGMRGGRGRYSY